MIILIGRAFLWNNGEKRRQSNEWCETMGVVLFICAADIYSKEIAGPNKPVSTVKLEIFVNVLRDLISLSFD